MDEKLKKRLEEIQKIGAIGRGIPNLSGLASMSSLQEKIAKVTPPDFGALAMNTPETQSLSMEEINEYQSAAVFIKSLAEEAASWKEALTEGFRPAIIALLYGGIQINVQSLSQVSFHGLRVEGDLNGQPCSILSHQSTVQILCVAQKVEPEVVKNPIGFIWSDGQAEV